MLTKKPIRHNRRQFLSLVSAGVTSGITTVAAWPDATQQAIRCWNSVNFLRGGNRFGWGQQATEIPGGERGF